GPVRAGPPLVTGGWLVAAGAPLASWGLPLKNCRVALFFAPGAHRHPLGSKDLMGCGARGEDQTLPVPDWLGSHEGECARLGGNPEQRGNSQDARQEGSPRRTSLHAANVQLLRSAFSRRQSRVQDL